MSFQALSGELFAGTGMLGRAVGEVFGTRPGWFCEFDAAPSKVLAHHYPDVPNYGDVTKVDWSAAPRVRVLAGGFPCQDVSLAGARRGMKDGTRSGLWSEYVKAIGAVRPDWVVIENVGGLLSADGEPWHEAMIAADAEVERLKVLRRITDQFANSNPARRREGKSAHVAQWKRAAVRLSRSHKRAVRARKREHGFVRRAIDTVLRDLADLGFDAEWCALRASEIGAPHGRLRVFILAWPAERTVATDATGVAGGRGTDTRTTRGRAGSVAAHADGDGLEGVGRVNAFGRGGADQARNGAELSAQPLTLLPTPTVVMNDGESYESWSARRDRVKATGVNGNGMGMPLPIAVQLLPTPGAYDGERGGSQHPDKRRDGGHSVTLQDVAEHALMPTPRASRGGSATETMYGLGATRVDDQRQQGQVALLPTPTVGNATGGNAQRGGNRGDEKLLPGIAVELAEESAPRTPDTRSVKHASDAECVQEGQTHASRTPMRPAPTSPSWGPYTAAIARWETVMGRPAPSPVRMDGKGGKARLNPELTEWMMGWPAGWVTASVVGLSRAEQLKACGNGVVLQQAIAALRMLLARPGVPAIEWSLAA